MMGETEKQKAIRALFPSIAVRWSGGVTGRAAQRAGAGAGGGGETTLGGMSGAESLSWLGQRHPGAGG